jgi:hypothetical protein
MFNTSISGQANVFKPVLVNETYLHVLCLLHVVLPLGLDFLADNLALLRTVDVCDGLNTRNLSRRKQILVV